MKLYKLFFISIIILLDLHSKELEKISLQLQWKDQFQFAGYYIAKEKGYYKDVGLDVELKPFSFEKNIVDEVLKQNTTYGTGRISLITNRSQGDKVVLLASILQSSPLVLASKQSSQFKTLKDLQNKKIKLTMSDNAPLIFALLASENINQKDIKYVFTKNKMESLINDEVDLASFYTSNQIYTLKNKGIKLNIFNPSDYGFDFYSDLLFTSEYEINNHPKRVEKFKEASLKGWRYAFEHIDETVNIILNKYNAQNKTKDALIYEANVLKELAYKNTDRLGVIDKYRIKSIHNLYKIIGITKGNINIDEFIYTSKEDNKIVFNPKEQEWIKNKKQITMCIDPDWMPFEKFNDGKHIGLTSDYYKIFEENLGIHIDIIKTKDWTQSLEYAKRRKCDILSLVMETPQRKKYMNFTTPYLKISLVLATKLNVGFITDFKSLKGEKLGIPQGYAFVELLRNKYPDLNIIEVKNLAEGLEKVNNGSLFGYIGTLASVGYAFQHKYTGELKIAGKFDEKWELGIGVRNDDPILFNIMQKAVNSINEETHQSILNKWVSIKYEETVDYKLLWEIAFITFIILLFLIYRQNLLKNANKNLQTAVDDKTKELLELNKNLENKVEEALKQNREKEVILFQQSKMASMGEMLGNIAHQWRQPLSVISSGAGSIQLKIEYDLFDKNEAIKDLQALERSAQFLSSTIDDFQNFLHPKKTNIVFNISDIVHKQLNMFGKSFESAGIKIITNMDNIEINGNPNELLQVVINILNNSKDALKDKNPDQKYIFVDIYKENDHAIIEIKDNAGGIPENIINKIFEAYFTTKHKAQGTGLGLYMSYQIITNTFKGNINAIMWTPVNY